MLLINNGTNPFANNGFVLPKGVKTEVPDDIAKKFLEIQGVERYIASADLEKATEDAEKRIKELETENKALKAKIADLEKATEDAGDDKTPSLEELKAEADALGIQYAPNISAKTLAVKIKAKKEQ